jgi:hypothetical protein
MVRSRKERRDGLGSGLPVVGSPSSFDLLRSSNFLPFVLQSLQHVPPTAAQLPPAGPRLSLRLRRAGLCAQKCR